VKPPPHPAKFKGKPAEWLFWSELAYRHEMRSTGWEPDPGEPEYDRDIAKDTCCACGRRRGSVEVEGELGGQSVTVTEFPDPCLGMLPGVGYACCGHGRSGRAVYVNSLHGPAAAQKMRELGGDPPPQAFHLDPIGEDKR
jgi:hypothetical protein